MQIFEKVLFQATYNTYQLHVYVLDAASTVTSSAGVPQSATQCNKKLKRDKFHDQWRNEFSWLVTVDDLTMYCQVYLWLRCLTIGGLLQASLLIVIWLLPALFSGCVNYFKGYQLIKFLVLSLFIY